MKAAALKFLRVDFVKNFAVVSGGGLVAQLILLGSAPLISRLYSPEAFGVQGLFLSLGGIMAAGAGLSYPVAIVLAREQHEAMRLLRLSCYIAGIQSLAALVLFYFFGAPFLARFGLSALNGVILLVPLFMFFTTLSAAVNQVCIRERQFGLTSEVNIVSAIVSVAARIGGGFFWASGAFLSLVSTFVLLLKTLHLWTRRKAPVTKGEPERQAVAGVGTYWALARRYGDFATLRTPQVLLSTITRGTPIILLGSLFDVDAAGLYAFAVTFLVIPVDLIATSIMQVLYPKITEAWRAGADIMKMIFQVTAILAAIGLLPVLLLFFAGPPLFELAFGSVWREAGGFAGWMAVLFYFQILTRPMLTAFPVLNLQKAGLVYEVAATVVKILAMYVGFYVFDTALTAVMLFSLAGTGMYVALMLWFALRPLDPTAARS